MITNTSIRPGGKPTLAHCVRIIHMKFTAADGFPYYFELAKEGLLTDMFSSFPTYELLKSLDEQQADYRYASGKWSIKQVVGHITDHERIKMSRAFQLSRRMPVELWGYDQEQLVNNSRFDELSINLLLEDYQNVRRSSQTFVQGLSEDQLNLKGMARGHEVTLADFLRSMIGHETHHLNVIRDRYLK